jgi:hypothetical protein
VPLASAASSEGRSSGLIGTGIHRLPAGLGRSRAAGVGARLVPDWVTFEPISHLEEADLGFLASGGKPVR